MSKFAAVTIAALMLMAVFISSASAANSTAIGAVEIRSPVFSGDVLSGITVNFDYTQFAGFYYEIDDDIGSETLSINNALVDDPRTITEGGLVYTTTIQQVGYEFEDWEANNQYPKMGFLAEEYVPINDKPDVLSKLLLDNDDKYTLRVGQTLDLGEGYTITPKQIDVEGDKVWLELSKDGVYLDDEVITVTDSDVDNSTWDYEEDDVGGEDDVVIMRVHVNEVFQGQTDSLAVIEGLWLISNEPMEIEGDDEFDELEVTNVGTNSLTLANKDDITLSADDEFAIAGDINVKTADSDDVRFYFLKVVSEPGTYEVRSSVATGDADFDYSSFAGFYYDLDDNLYSEELSISSALSSSDRTIDENDLTYTTTLQYVNYEFEDWEANDEYPKMGFLAEEYVPVNDKPDVLSKLLVDNDDKYTLRVGQTLDLGDGYTITPKQIDVEGDKVWLELSKDGVYLDDEVITVTDSDVDNSTWDYEEDDVGGEDDVVVMRVHVNEVFQGQTDSLAVIEGMWLISNEPLEIEGDDEFDELEVTNVGTNSLTLQNTDDITLSADDDLPLAGNMNLKVADDSANLRYYLYAEYVVGGGNGTTSEGTTTTPTNVTTEIPTTTGNVTTPVGETPAGETPAGETPAGETPAGNETPVDEDTPGFEAIFAVGGLLAVAYLVRRN